MNSRTIKEWNRIHDILDVLYIVEKEYRYNTNIDTIIKCYESRLKEMEK